MLANLNCLWAGGIDQELSVLLRGDAELVEVLLELVSELFHRGHVCEQNGLNNSFLDQLDVLSRELAAQEVVLRNVKQLHRLGGMEVLLDVLFAVHLADR